MRRLHLALALPAPLREDFPLHLLELSRGGPAGLGHEDQVQSVARFERAVPGSGLEREQGRGECRAEQARHRVLVQVLEVHVQEQRVAHAARRVRRAERGQLEQRVLGVRGSLRPPTRVEVDLHERHTLRLAEALAVRGLVPAQLVLGRLRDARVLDQERELLREATPDHRVPFCEPERFGLAGEQLLLEQGVEQPPQLVLRGLPLPLLRERLGQPAQLAVADVHRLAP
jgi:hypothetical protein